MLHILVVEDEAVIGENIVQGLEGPRRKVALAKDGEEALRLTSEQEFDIVITDHRMPRTGGLQLVRELRGRGFEGKIVVLSGYLSPENIGTYEELAVDEVVGKPIESEELRDLIRTLEDDL